MGTMAYFHSTKTCRLIGDLRLAVGVYVKSCGYVSLCFSALMDWGSVHGIHCLLAYAQPNVCNLQEHATFQMEKRKILAVSEYITIYSSYMITIGQTID